MTNPVMVEEAPSAAEFIELRRIMGSPEVDEETATKTINRALLRACATKIDFSTWRGPLAMVLAQGICHTGFELGQERKWSLRLIDLSSAPANGKRKR